MYKSQKAIEKIKTILNQLFMWLQYNNKNN